MNNEYIQISTTLEKREDAENIAGALVEGRLVACAQIVGPITSTYWWKGKIEKAEEWICLLKSDKALYSDIEKSIRKLHPYENPEIVAVPIISGSSDYLTWISEETRRGL